MLNKKTIQTMCVFHIDVSLTQGRCFHSTKHTNRQGLNKQLSNQSTPGCNLADGARRTMVNGEEITKGKTQLIPT